MSEFFRFPHTPHIVWMGAGSPRDDKILSPAEVDQLLRGHVVVEEKLDGANLGISLSADGELIAQNRGNYLHEPYSGQFARLPDWLSSHSEDLVAVFLEHLEDDLILFGEWCAARHTLDYKGLPDWFLLFDVYERSTGRFWSSPRRNELAFRAGLATVPLAYAGQCSLSQLKDLLRLNSSRYRNGPMEGLIVRRESERLCEERAKIVQADFIQTIGEHWRQRRIEWNRLAS